jgi:hypothetical protein
MLIFNGDGTVASAPSIPMTDLALWISALHQSGATDSNPVYPLTDFSGNSRDGTQTSPDTTKQCTYHSSGGANGQPYLSFDGNDAYELPNFLTGYTAAHVFIVVKETNDPAVSTASCLGPCAHFGTGAGGNTLYPFTNGVIHDCFGSTTRHDTGNPTPSLASWRLYEILTKSGEWTSWIDGTQHFTTASNTMGFPTNPLIAGDGAGNFFVGDLEEIMLYGADIGSTDIASVKSYVSSTYGLTIA